MRKPRADSLMRHEPLHVLLLRVSEFTFTGGDHLTMQTKDPGSG